LLAVKFDVWFAWITIVALAVYITFTVTVTQWRTQFRRQMNELDSSAHSRAIDSLLNYETVKYFNNEEFEAGRYDESLERYRKAAIKSQRTLSLLNTGQQLIIAVSLVAMLYRATQGVVDGRMTLGDLVMVNAFMIQLYIPLGFSGHPVPRDQAEPDRSGQDVPVDGAGTRDCADPVDALPLVLDGEPDIRFEHVDFTYDSDKRLAMPGLAPRTILHDVSFEIPAGKTVAVVGPSGAGKSTLARLLYRFYDVQGGRITIAGQDIRTVTQASVRARRSASCRRTRCLFNDTIAYNIAYGALRVPARRRWSRPRWPRASTTSSSVRRPATTPWSANAG
jgi:ABC-type transport system involved in Fe-S cluster assembly fused permease/ATPase subunit